MESVSSIVAVLRSLSSPAVWAWRLVRNRPRLAQPEFCVHDGDKVVKLANAGRAELDIESVRFEFTDMWGERTRIELLPEQDGPIPAKRGIDCNDPAAAWQRFYYFVAPHADSDGAFEAASAAVSDTGSRYGCGAETSRSGAPAAMN